MRADAVIHFLNAYRDRRVRVVPSADEIARAKALAETLTTPPFRAVNT
jgi:hypothetical protein